MVEMKNFCSFVSLTYERLPDFCNYYNSIGHPIANCHWNNKKDGDSNPRGRSRSRTFKFHKHQVSLKASSHRQSSQGVSRTVPHIHIDQPQESPHVNNILVTEPIPTIDDPVVPLSNKGKEKVVPTNSGLTIASLMPYQLNATKDMIPVQSDLPSPLLPPLIPVDNQDSINPNFISNHVTPPSGDIVVATNSHDTLLCPTATRGHGGTCITDSTKSINARAYKPPT